MGQIEEQLADRLKSTFKLYIRFALQNALSDNPSDNEVLQTIINMQAALELISKYFVLQNEGWKGIIISKFHDRPESEILELIADGSIQTTPYWKNKEYISDEIYLNDDDRLLLEKFQKNRNQVMHLGMANSPKEILNESIWFMVRIINQLNWHDTLPSNEQYLSNCLESLLGVELYVRLLNSSCYISESIDRANEMYPDDIKHCLQCANDSWVLTDEGFRLCFVCGFRGDADVFGFTDCPLCNGKGEIVFDALNIDYNDYLRGKCCLCREFINVSKCKECEHISIYPKTCDFCIN